MPLIKGGHFVEDAFVTIGDSDPLAPSGKPIVSFERFRNERNALLGRNSSFGVRLKPDDDPAVLHEDIERISVVAIEFPTFRDGRGFSRARVLRSRLGFKGEIRAVGHFLYDQLAFMVRTGFDAFEVPQTFREEDFQRALKEMSYFYQPSVDGKKTIRELRATR
jgi:uncharacterized protein (DUF934 family)